MKNAKLVCVRECVYVRVSVRLCVFIRVCVCNIRVIYVRELPIVLFLPNNRHT